MPARSRHCNRGVGSDSATDDCSLGRLLSNYDSEARRPACSASTAVPTGDREVLKIRAIANFDEGPL